MSRKRESVNGRLRRRARESNVQRVPSSAERKRMVAHAHNYWGAFGTYLGHKKKAGRWTREIALVCFTDDKPALRSIPKEKRIPKAVSWTERRRRYRIGTDVIKAERVLHLQQGAVLGPGDGVRFGPSEAMIGAAIDHPNFGRCVTTAGHLFGGPGAIGGTAQATTGGEVVPATVMQCVFDHALDYALLLPDVACDCDNLFQDLVRIGPLYVPEPADVGRQLLVLDGINDSVPTVCHGVNASLTLDSGAYDDVILTDAVTEEGQSGAALVDTKNRLWGFLLGEFDEFSVFMPAYAMLTQEQSRLA